MKDKKLWFKRGLRDGFPIFLGYFAVSFTLGIAARKVGMTALQATLMSVTNYTSAGQFAAIGLIGAGTTYLEMAVTQLVINIRYFLMSCALSQKLPVKPQSGLTCEPQSGLTCEPQSGLPFYHRLFVAGTVTDEIFGISAAVEGKLNPFYSYGAMAFAALGWGGGTFFGVVTGNAMPARLLSAFSVALYGMFIAVIVPQAKQNKILRGLIAISMLCSFAFAKLPIISEISSGFRIILLTVLIAGAAAVFYPVKEEEGHAE